VTTINVTQVRDELCEFLRRSDVLSTTVRGVTRTTGTYTVGAGGETTHTFTGNIPVRDFYLLTVDSVAKYYLRDYTINWTTGVLTWGTALTNGQVVAYQVDWGTGDKIYPDMPRDDLTLTSYPRMGIELTGLSTMPFGIGGDSHISDIVITIIVWVPVNKDTAVAGGFGGLNDLESTMNLIRAAIRSNAKSFYTFPWIYPRNRGPLNRGTNNKIMQMSSDYFIRFKVE
jgi:hypothetical protein